MGTRWIIFSVYFLLSCCPAVIAKKPPDYPTNIVIEALSGQEVYLTADQWNQWQDRLGSIRSYTIDNAGYLQNIRTHTSNTWARLNELNFRLSVLTNYAQLDNYLLGKIHDYTYAMGVILQNEVSWAVQGTYAETIDMNYSLRYLSNSVLPFLSILTNINSSVIQLYQGLTGLVFEVSVTGLDLEISGISNLNETSELMLLELEAINDHAAFLEIISAQIVILNANMLGMKDVLDDQLEMMQTNHFVFTNIWNALDVANDYASNTAAYCKASLFELSNVTHWVSSNFTNTHNSVILLSNMVDSLELHSGYLASISNSTLLTQADIRTLRDWASPDGRGLKVWGTDIFFTVGVTMTGYVDIGTTGVVQAQMPDMEGVDTNFSLMPSESNYNLEVGTALIHHAASWQNRIDGFTNTMEELGSPTAMFANAQDVGNIGSITPVDPSQSLGWGQDSDWSFNVDLSGFMGAGNENIKIGFNWAHYPAMVAFRSLFRAAFIIVILVTAGSAALQIYRGAEQ